MENEKSSLYDKLPLELLAGFYYEINKNIEKGILSDAMYQEIRLMEQTALRRGISLEYLNDKGAFIIEAEKPLIETTLQHQIVE
ncbi:hypothetical protein [Peribacillus sp. V2I11]|uniref:hypothetical protein n=1 Tax=Peribacillus sp. V2I11 TaxID=3042277 RepID=UPI00277E917C|nr:hypothetical protein [Peribacillus sp. V2I11]MDQ0879074.1 hypothetical protein [Peribacillus sp. V2I11]